MSTQYQISHVTRYIYSSPVSVCHNVLTLTPRSGSHVQCLSHRVRVKPNPPEMQRQTDFFGNQLTVFSIDENHLELTITAHSRVSVEKHGPPEPQYSPKWQQMRTSIADQSEMNWLAASKFLFDSPRVERDETFKEYALESFVSGRDVFGAAQGLCARINQDFTYDATATHSATPTAEAFSIRRGVCQDFAHVMIACLRSVGIPARYVSGYLRTIPPPGQKRLVGADQSHAWVSVYCGHQLGWVELDPTNNCLASSDHIPIAWGRDYSDVVPVRGAFLGGGDSRISVSVDVVPVDPM